MSRQATLLKDVVESDSSHLILSAAVKQCKDLERVDIDLVLSSTLLTILELLGKQHFGKIAVRVGKIFEGRSGQGLVECLKSDETLATACLFSHINLLVHNLKIDSAEWQSCLIDLVFVGYPGHARGINLLDDKRFRLLRLSLDLLALLGRLGGYLRLITRLWHVGLIDLSVLVHTANSHGLNKI